MVPIYEYTAGGSAAALLCCFVLVFLFFLLSAAVCLGACCLLLLFCCFAVLSQNRQQKNMRVGLGEKVMMWECRALHAFFCGGVREWREITKREPERLFLISVPSSIARASRDETTARAYGQLARSYGRRRQQGDVAELDPTGSFNSQNTGRGAD